MNIGNTVRHFREYIFLSKDEKYFIKHFSENNELSSNATGKKLKILIQMPENYYFLVLFALVIQFLKRLYTLEIHWITIACEFQRIGKGSFLKRNSFFERKWTKLYTSLGGKMAFSNLCYSFDEDIIKDAHDIFSSLKISKDLVDLRYKDVLVGDLVYDTYLRFKPAPTIDLKDEFLERILKSALQLVKNADAFTKKEQHDYLFTSYTSYIHHGVMTRVCLKDNVKVILLGLLDPLSKKITSFFSGHTKDYYWYKETFEKIEPIKQSEHRETARISLEGRFQGRGDPGTYYMRQAAYSGNKEFETRAFKETSKKRAVIFLHCFFDSPHVYRYMHYSDLYEWADTTIRIASSQSEFDFYVKPHPNAIKGNVEIVEKLKKKYPNVSFIPAETSNNQLTKEGFDVAFTVHGTLGHELPFFGISVVNAGDNPHVNYSFAVHAKSRDEYENYVKNIDQVPAVPSDVKDQIFEFYYMHNFYKSPGKLTVDESNFVRGSLEWIQDSKQLVDFLEKCYADKDYQDKIESLIGKSLLEVL